MDFNYFLKVSAWHFALWDVCSEKMLSQSSSVISPAWARGKAWSLRFERQVFKDFLENGANFLKRKKPHNLFFSCCLLQLQSFASPYKRSRWCSLSFQMEIALAQLQEGQLCAMQHRLAGFSPVLLVQGSLSFEWSAFYQWKGKKEARKYILSGEWVWQ